MANVDFKDLKSLEKYLQGQINSSLQIDVAKDVVGLMKKNIETEVYAKYTPSGTNQYERRREDGGLLDDSNYLIEPIAEGVSITNITTDGGHSENFGDYITDPNTWIVPIIEYGKGYSWENSLMYQKPFARPFVSETREQLKSGLAKQFLKNSLSKKGLIVE